MKRLLLIINPVAGRGGFRFPLGGVCEELAKGGYALELRFTNSSGDAERLARELAGDFDVVACIGGDGTLSEVVSGLMAHTAPPTLGYIPLGTTNDVARTLKLPKNPRLAAKRIVKGHTRKLDVGAFGDSEYFAYIAAFGAFSEISYTTRQDMKKSFGHLAYMMEGFMSLPRLRPYRARVELDDEVIEAELAFGGVTNTLSVAGIVRLDDKIVGLEDGKFEVVLVKNPDSLAEFNQILSGLMTRNYQSPYVSVLNSKTARFQFDEPVAWTRDGESGGEHRELVLRNLPSAISIFV